MLTKLNSLVFGQAHVLLHLYLICLMIHLALLLLEVKGSELRTLLPLFVRNEFVSVCLIIMCGVLDKMLPYLSISWDWSIALLFTLLVILDEMLWIVARASKYVSVGFLKDTLNNLVKLLQQKISH